MGTATAPTEKGVGRPQLPLVRSARWSSFVGPRPTPSLERGLTRQVELELERRVSRYIRELPYVWVRVDDEPGPKSLRSYLERNSIALLSNWEKPSLDSASTNWLGADSKNSKIAESGLWNSNHVRESYESSFLKILEQRVRLTATKNPGDNAMLAVLRPAKSPQRQASDKVSENETEQERDVKWWALQDSNLEGQRETVAKSGIWRAAASSGDKLATKTESGAGPKGARRGAAPGPTESRHAPLQPTRAHDDAAGEVADSH